MCSLVCVCWIFFGNPGDLATHISMMFVFCSSNKYLKPLSIRFVQFLVCFSAELNCFFQSIICDLKAFELPKGVVGQAYVFSFFENSIGIWMIIFQYLLCYHFVTLKCFINDFMFFGFCVFLGI